MLALALAPLALAAAPPPEPTPRLDVTGVGEVWIAPDEAILTLGVRARADEAARAFDATTLTLRQVVDAVSASVPAERIRTSRLSLEPRYAYDGGPPRLIGYEASATLELRLDTPADAGSVLDAAVGAGANEVLGVNWVVEDEAAVRAEALEAAVTDARRNAEQVAEELGVSLGAPLGVRIRSEQSRPMPLTFERATDRGDADVEMPVFSGEQTYRAEVDVSFRIAPEAEPGS